MQFAMMQYARENGATSYDFGELIIIQIKIHHIMVCGPLKSMGNILK